MRGRAGRRHDREAGGARRCAGSCMACCSWPWRRRLRLAAAAGGLTRDAAGLRHAVRHSWSRRGGAGGLARLLRPALPAGRGRSRGEAPVLAGSGCRPGRLFRQPPHPVRVGCRHLGERRHAGGRRHRGGHDRRGHRPDQPDVNDRPDRPVRAGFAATAGRAGRWAASAARRVPARHRSGAGGADRQPARAAGPVRDVRAGLLGQLRFRVGRLALRPALTRSDVPRPARPPSPRLCVH